MTATSKLASIFFRFLRPEDAAVYGLCRRFADRYDGNNDCNMLTNGEWRFMRQMLAESETVFDVGANAGEWAALALGVNPKLSLHCFEPNGAAFRLLSERAFPDNVRRNNVGMSSTQGQRELYLFEDGSGLNSMYRREGLEDGWGLETQQRTQVIQVDTVDHYCANHGIGNIDLLKMDVEGHELEVLKGASRMIANGRIRAIQFEYGGCNIDARVLLQDFFRLLRPSGYTLFKVFPGELRRVERYDQRFENFQYQNWVALLPG